MTDTPTEKEVLSYFDTLSNWGRWGEDDQKGTLNFLTAKKTLQSVRLIKEGFTVSCARPLIFEPSPDAVGPAVHYMVESGEGWSSGDKVTSRVSQAATDYIGTVSYTHLTLPTILLV